MDQQQNGGEVNQPWVKTANDIEYENKSVILYSEAGSFLSAMKYPYFTLISVGTNTDASKKGHSGAFNKIYQSDMFVPANKSSATIHTHPDAGLYRLNFGNGFYGYADTEGRGPTRNHDYPMPGAPYRNVVVDDRYIYLINHDSRQNIIIRRPGK